VVVAAPAVARLGRDRDSQLDLG